ncbi:MAG: DUF1501 domain-containing protein [Acidobacteriota bacterium]
MNDLHTLRGCTEYRTLDRQSLSRRRFLAAAGGSLGLAAASSWLPRVAFADSADAHAVSAGERDVVVSIFLRGGADGLTLCVPHAESEYYRLRPTLAVARPDDTSQPAAARALDLDGRFGLPPALAPLERAYRDGALAIVHACGLGHPTRSHFDAMHLLEVGRLDAPATEGWLGRHLRTAPATRPNALLRAAAFGHALPRTLVGAPAAVPLPDPSAYGPLAPPEVLTVWWRALASLYRGADNLLRDAARGTIDTVELLGAVNTDSYRPSDGVVYPETEFGRALHATASLIVADLGLEAATVDLGGWDTHDVQGSTDGVLAERMTVLAGGLDAFYRDLAARGRHRVTVLVLSEFGRNVVENGSRGTDHGHAGALFALGIGGGVAGGRVITDWPGLAPDRLYEGQDLERTIDTRDVLAEALRKRVGRDDAPSLFAEPSYDWTDRGVFR